TTTTRCSLFPYTTLFRSNEIRRQIKVKKQLLDKLLGQVLVKYSEYLNESLIVKRNDRYVIPVKDAYKNKIKGVIHDISASKQTVDRKSTRLNSSHVKISY